MNKYNLKLIMELIFIFILPLVFICFTSEIQIEREFTYDNNGNYEISQETKNLSFDNSIIKFVNDNHYINYLNYNNYANYNVENVKYNNNSFVNNNYSLIISNLDEQTYYNYSNININENHVYLLIIYNYVIDNGYITNRITTNNTFNFTEFNYNTDNNIYYIEINNTDSVGLMVDARTSYSSYTIPNTLNFNYQLIDLSQLFYNDIPNNYLDLIDYSINESYSDSNIILIESSNIISGKYEVNYTVWGNIKQLLIDNLDLNDNVLLDIVLCYTILWFIMFLIWHLLYGFLELLFHVIPSRWKEGSLR